MREVTGQRFKVLVSETLSIPGCLLLFGRQHQGVSSRGPRNSSRSLPHCQQDPNWPSSVSPQDGQVQDTDVTSSLSQPSSRDLARGQTSSSTTQSSGKHSRKGISPSAAKSCSLRIRQATPSRSKSSLSRPASARSARVKVYSFFISRAFRPGRRAGRRRVLPSATVSIRRPCPARPSIAGSPGPARRGQSC